MKGYLLDTNICIYFLKGLYGLDKKIADIGLENCFLSEISLAELRFGAENSQKVKENKQVVQSFADKIGILPIFNSLDIYAKEKARLRKQGTPVDDFDLLIGASAIANNLTLVTNNIKHFKQLKDIKLEDWTANKKK